MRTNVWLVEPPIVVLRVPDIAVFVLLLQPVPTPPAAEHEVTFEAFQLTFKAPP